MGRRHGRVATRSRTGPRATVSFRRRRVRTTGTGLGTRADHLANNDEDS